LATAARGDDHGRGALADAAGHARIVVAHEKARQTLRAIAVRSKLRTAQRTARLRLADGVVLERACTLDNLRVGALAARCAERVVAYRAGLDAVFTGVAGGADHASIVVALEEIAIALETPTLGAVRQAAWHRARLCNAHRIGRGRTRSLHELHVGAHLARLADAVLIGGARRHEEGVSGAKRARFADSIGLIRTG